MQLLERDVEMNLLISAAQAAAEGHGSLVSVTGEAGVGKTSLLRAFGEHASENYRILWGACEALFTPRPLGPLQDIAASLQDASLQDLFNAGAQQGALFPVVAEDLRTSSKPTVLIFEDVHWADHATMDFIKFLGRRIHLLPALFVITFRNDEEPGNHPLRTVLGDIPSTNVKRIELTPLSKAGVEVLAKSVQFPSAGLFEATQGNPFFVTEIIAHSHIEQQQPVPATVTDAVWARIGRLDNDARSLLDFACVQPGRMELWLAHALLGERAHPAIDTCMQRHFLQPAAVPDCLMFRHEIARRATEAALSPTQRMRIHAKVLSLLDVAGNIPASRLIFHAEQSGNVSRVLELAPIAAQQAAALGAHYEAAAHLATGLKHSMTASRELKAELLEQWSYEAGLARQIDSAVINARHEAIAIRRELGQTEKICLNLRWLSRLHWYLGEKTLADQYVNEAVTLMERLLPSAEKAWATSVRSQMYMLTDDTANAVVWGERAADMAQQLEEDEILCHALNNVGTALLFAHNPDGINNLAESLRISLDKGYHEQAARAFNNLSEYLVVFKQYTSAERYISEGIAFDTKHDLDSWTHYLEGWQAQLKFEQGRYVEAEEIASRVLALPHLTAIMKLPAMTVIGRLHMRTGVDRGKQMLEAAMALALPLEEPQRVVPLACALAEAAWLASDNQACLKAVEPALRLTMQGNNPWELGELAVWRHRAGATTLPLERHALPYRYEIAGDIAAAAKAWAEVGNPYEQALALAQGDDQQLLTAIKIFDELGAKPATKWLRDKAHLLGLRGIQRGPYKGVREHPLGLSKREVEVIQLIASGHTNAEIAKSLSRSERTVEHHISSLILKLGAKNRIDAVRRHAEFTLALKKREK